MTLSEASAEKVYAAEKNVAVIRVAVIALNSLVYLTLMGPEGTIPWLAYTIIAVANLYGLGILLYQPYRRYPLLLSSVFTAVSDGSLITLWLMATGGYESPFFVLWYVSIVAVAFRFNYRETLGVSVLYAAAYVLLLAGMGELLVSPSDVIVRVTYILFVAALGGLISRELLQQTQAKVEMRQLMREARLAEARFRGLLEAAPDAIVIANAEGRIVLVNDQTKALFGYKREELLGRPTGHLLPASLQEVLEAEARAMTDAGPHGERTLGSEVEGRRKDGSSFPADIRMRTIGTPDGPIVPIIVRDMTERRRAERELEDHAAELARSNAELEQFAYVASHDLQEPLRMVASYVQLLERRYGGQLDEDASTFISYAVEGATRMQTLINDLLAFSRVGTSSEPLAPVDLGKVLDHVLANLSLTIKDHGAEITHDPMPAVLADAGQIEQVLQNLISNALKFRGEASPKVHVSAERREDRWVIGIHDNGIGIEPQFHDRIFTLFQRLHTRDQYEGTGIGLSICKKIVERHGGRIWVASAGSIVPAVVQVVDEPGQEETRAGPPNSPHELPGGPPERPWRDGSSFFLTLRAIEGTESHPPPEPEVRTVTPTRESDTIARRAQELV